MKNKLPIYTCPAEVHKAHGIYPRCIGCEHYDRDKKGEVECWQEYKILPTYFVTKNGWRLNCEATKNKISLTEDMELKAEDRIEFHKKYDIKITNTRVILKGGF